jgi:hypothetical protein
MLSTPLQGALSRFFWLASLAAGIRYPGNGLFRGTSLFQGLSDGGPSPPWGHLIGENLR